MRLALIRASLLLLSAAAGCSRDGFIKVPFPPEAEQGTEILVVAREGGAEAFVVALEQRSIVFPFELQAGEEVTLEALIYAEAPGALGLELGPFAEPQPGGPPLQPAKTWSLRLAGDEASSWKEEASLSASARRFRPRVDPGCVPIAEEECGVHDLSGLIAEPIAPLEGLWSLSELAENNDGVLLGLGDEVLVLFDRRRGGEPVTVRLPANYHQTAKTATALRSGDFLISGRRNHALNDGHRYSRVELQRDPAGSLTGARISEVVLRPQAVVANELAYASASSERPLYIFGQTPGSRGDAIVLACKDDAALDCIEEPLAAQCQGEVNENSPKAGVSLQNGIGVAIAATNLYFRPAGGAWSCQPAVSRLFPFADQSRAPVTVSLRSIAAIGDRVFLCGTSVAPSCAAGAGVVISAAANAPPGEMPDPRFEIIARGDDYSSCAGLFNVPGDPNRVRAVMSDRRTYDFDGQGRSIATATIAAAPRPAAIKTVLPSGTVIAGTTANVVQASSANAPFEQLYGATSTTPHAWRELVAYEDSFFAFTSVSIVRIDTTPRGAGLLPETRMRPVRDPFGAFRESQLVVAAALDHASTRDAGVPVFVLGGYDIPANRAFLRRISIDGNQISGAEEIELDPPVGPEIQSIAEIGEHRFIALTAETRVVEIIGTQATELPVDFDAINTPEIEEVPTTISCSGATFRLGRWRGLAGGRCAAWAVGGGGMMARIAGSKVTRLMARAKDEAGDLISVIGAYNAVDATCADRVMIAGSQIRFTYGVTSISAPADACYPGGSVSEDVRGLELRAFPQGPELDCVNARGGDETNGPDTIKLLGDGTYGAALLANGFIHRYRPDKTQDEDPRVPFAPAHAVQNARGYILIAGFDSQLAIAASAR